VGADFRALDVTTTARGSNFILASEQIPGRNKKLEITLPLAGRHNVVHACAAAAVASVLGIDGDLIRRGLESATPVSGRLQPLSGIGGAYVYDDSYNANPASVTAAAQFIANCAGEGGGEGWLVLGDMRELGNDAEELHRTVGDEARKAGVRRLFATGPLSRLTVESFGSNAVWYENTDQLVRELVAELERNASRGINVLVKGSRSMQMERVVHALHAGAVQSRGN
jgi:UDP-N-acetylmuramoyl-tripeptide--D-alanyl-D-alanine ligase